MEGLNLEQQPAWDHFTDKLLMSLTDLRIIGNPKNQFNNAEEILFNHVQHTEVGKENLKAKQRKLESWK